MQPENQQLQDRMVELASERRRFGYRRIHPLLRREGLDVNYKRIFRLYQGCRIGSKASTQAMRGGNGP
jgi:putative transposase